MAPRRHQRDSSSIRRQRTERGWSQTRFIQELRASAAQLGDYEPGVTVAMVSKWENGKSAPSDRYRRLIDHAFARTLVVGDDSWEDEMQRRAFLHSSATAGLALFGYSVGSEPWQRLDSTLRHASVVDDVTTDNLETLTTTFGRLFLTATPTTVVNPVRSHLDTLAQLLNDHSLRQAQRRRLASLAAETAILLGWINKDVGEHGTAQQYFLTAIEAATAGEDRSLGAYALACASTLPAFRANPDQTVHLLAEAEVKGVRADQAQGATRAYVLTLEAEARGRAGDQAGALRAFDEAAPLVDTAIDPVDRRPRLPFFDSTRFLAERGLAAVKLGLASEGRTALDAALGQMPGDRRIRSRFLTNLANAQLRLGDIDQACETALGSLDITKRSNIHTAADELRRFRRELDSWADTRAVKNFDDRLHELAAADPALNSVLA
jgi:transcriptional regulator with XRE-family HTH domain/tetratricopeptide (TPR) repeat protein